MTRTLALACTVALACGKSDSTEPPAETPPPEPSEPAAQEQPEQTGTAEEPSQPEPQPTNQAAEATVPADWQRVEGEGFSFAVPPGWEVRDNPDFAGQKFASGSGDVHCNTFNRAAVAGDEPLVERVRAHVIADELDGNAELMGEGQAIEVGGQPGVESRYRHTGAGNVIRRTIEHDGHWVGIECGRDGDEPLAEAVESIVASYALGG